MPFKFEGFDSNINDLLYRGEPNNPQNLPYNINEPLNMQAMNQTIDEKVPGIGTANYEYLPPVGGIGNIEDKLRPDFSVKSQEGFLGPKETKKGYTMTEYSMGMPIKQPDGTIKEMDVPSMVPTLTDDEFNLLRQSADLSKDERVQFEKDNQDMFNVIKRKAVSHAEQRLQEGKSVYFDETKEERKSNFTIEDNLKKIFNNYKQ